MTAADDANLDELKRRARRRLVGAIVLALVVAVVVPMLLESDPKPLGEDVAVRIPPVDDGKFVNRLSDKGKADSPKAPARSDAKSEARPEPKAEPARAEAPKAEAEPIARSTAASPEPAADKADAGAAGKTESAKAESATAAKGEPSKEAPKATTTGNASFAGGTPANVAAGSAAPAAAGIPAASANGLFAVQVYAFSDAYGANSLVGKLKRAGYPAYSESTESSKGTLWRVRIGPYASREVAATARDKLKGEGYNGIVTTR